MLRSVLAMHFVAWDMELRIWKWAIKLCLRYHTDVEHIILKHMREYVNFLPNAVDFNVNSDEVLFLHVWTWKTLYTLGKKGCYIPGWCVFFVIISISSVREV